MRSFQKQSSKSWTAKELDVEENLEDRENGWQAGQDAEIASCFWQKVQTQDNQEKGPRPPSRTAEGPN